MTLLLSLLGGLLALDQTSLGQFMLSRPLVSATLAGWILGDPGAGLVAGALLEVLFLPAFPVGGTRFPEGGPAGIVAASAAIAGTAGSGAGLGMAVGLGTVWGLVGGWSITALRRLNERITPVPGEGILQPSRVVAGHLGALGVDFLRGAVLTALGVMTARTLSPLVLEIWIPDVRRTALAFGILAALSLGGLLAGLGGWREHRRLVLGGLFAGAVMGWML